MNQSNLFYCRLFKTNTELVKRVSFDNQVYTLPLMAKEESALKLKTPTGSVAGPADNPQAPSQSSHSSLKSDDENPDDNYVSS